MYVATYVAHEYQYQYVALIMDNSLTLNCYLFIVAVARTQLISF
jgi:hypothetical protein